MLDRKVNLAKLGQVSAQALLHDFLQRHHADARFAEGSLGCLGVVGHRSVTDAVHELLPIQTQFRHDHVDEGLLGIGEPVERQGHGDLAQGEGRVDLGGFVLEPLGIVGGQDEGQNEVVDLGEADGLGGVLHGGIVSGRGAKVKGDRKNISLSVPPCRGSHADLRRLFLHDVVDEANGLLVQVIEEDLRASDGERDDVVLRVLSGHDGVPVDRATCEAGGTDVERGVLEHGLLVNPQASIVVLVQGHTRHDVAATADDAVHGRQSFGDFDDGDLDGVVDGDERGGDDVGGGHAYIVTDDGGKHNRQVRNYFISLASGNVHVVQATITSEASEKSGSP